MALERMNVNVWTETLTWSSRLLLLLLLKQLTCCDIIVMHLAYNVDPLSREHTTIRLFIMSSSYSLLVQVVFFCVWGIFCWLFLVLLVVDCPERMIFEMTYMSKCRIRRKTLTVWHSLVAELQSCRLNVYARVRSALTKWSCDKNHFIWLLTVVCEVSR